MAEKKSQTLVRAEPGDLAKWKEFATIRGQSLNQWLIEAANWHARASDVAGAAMEAFTSTIAAPITSSVANTDPLLAFDLALNQTPTLTGARKWVDPQALREEFEKLVAPGTTDAS